MRSKIKNICIVGGGSSGWMAALAILRNLKDVSLTLIESSKLGNVGVGEATIPFVAEEFKSLLGLEEEDWMKECDATYKAAIRFVNFNSLDKNDIIYHPFFSQDEMNTPINWWLNKSIINNDDSYQYYKDVYFSTTLCEENKFGFSKKFNIDHAHNLDASKFGNLCKRVSIEKGLKHIDALVAEVDKDENGIKSLLLDNGEKITSDLFIDATGFRALLIEKTLGDTFVSIEDKIINNSALFARVGYKDKDKELNPYVDCVAKSAGWCWNIPLWSRSGNGYVYSNNFISDEEAEKEFRQHLGVDDSVDVNKIKMRTGYQKNPWTKNCIALPLAGGFVEPLESSGLMLVLASIRDFVSVIKDNNGTVSGIDRQLFNKNIKGAIDDVVDFVQAHYALTDREDTEYWKHIKYEVKPTDGLIEKLHLLKTNPNVSTHDLNTSNYGFPLKSWECILMGLKPNILRHKFRESAKHELENFFNVFEGRRHEMGLEISKMGSHAEFLSKNVYGK